MNISLEKVEDFVMSNFDQRSLDPVVERVPEAPVNAPMGYVPAESLLKRAYMFLEDGNYPRADEYFEKALDIDPENPRAYLGKLLIQLRLRVPGDLQRCVEPFDGNYFFQKTMRFADPALRDELNGYRTQIFNRKYQAALEILETNTSPNALKGAEAAFRSLGAYGDAPEKAELCRQRADFYAKDERYLMAKNTMERARTEKDYLQAAEIFTTVLHHKDAAELRKVCQENAVELRCAASYKLAVSYQEKGYYAKAKVQFQEISDYKDAEQRITDCQKMLDWLRQKKTRRKKIALLSLAVVLLLVLIVVVSIKPIKYKVAENKIDSDPVQAAMEFYELGTYKDAWERSFNTWGKVTRRETLSAAGSHTVGVTDSGAIVAVGNDEIGQCDVNDWMRYDIAAVSAGFNHTVGLKTDGTVVATGSNLSGQCNVEGWTDIVAISAGKSHTVGLKADGTVVACGYNEDGRCNVEGWTDIVAVSAGSCHTVGLKADGTVVATGSHTFGQCSVSGLTDIVEISAGAYHTVALKSDGTVVAVGASALGQGAVEDWTDIVMIDAGGDYTAGVKADGTVVITGNNSDAKYDLSGWTDIVAISVGENHIVGLTSSGMVATAGFNNCGQCDASKWEYIKVP